jgi:Tfp pilus assembly protein PilF
MNRTGLQLIVMLMALSLIGPGLGWAQSQSEVAAQLNEGYDLLEQGKTDQAQKVYEDFLKKHPGQPLALNNLGAIKCKQGKHDQALVYLKQALTRAQGVKVTLNRVCNVDGVCAAYRMSEGQFGSEDLDAVIKSNILMLEMARSDGQRAK